MMRTKENTSVCGAESCARRRISEVTTTESTMRHSFQYTVGKLQSPCSLAPAPALPRLQTASFVTSVLERWKVSKCRSATRQTVTAATGGTVSSTTSNTFDPSGMFHYGL